MTVRSGRAFVDELMRALPSSAHPPARRVLARYRGRSLYLPRDRRAARVEAAATMLRFGVSPGDATTALQERFGVSLATAKRDVRAARGFEER